MGIVNMTPDSFSDGGVLTSTTKTLAYIEKLIAEGADIIDIGAESTRPGALPVLASEQIKRIGQVISEVKKQFDTLVSIDTSDAEVIAYAVEQGVDIVNDVRALQQSGALSQVANSQVALVLMHMQGQPQAMQIAPQYDNVVDEISAFLQQRVDACNEAGISNNRIVLDPGFGFGKSLQQNIDLLKNLSKLTTGMNYPYPILAGLSRKSMIEKITGAVIEERLSGSIALALCALQNGAQILRVHDVKATKQACQIWQYIVSH